MEENLNNLPFAYHGVDKVDRLWVVTVGKQTGEHAH